jgi:hypothetical protein
MQPWCATAERDMALLAVDCDEQSRFYATTDSGLLYFYQDQARDGQGVWAFGGQPQQIGQGWQTVTQITAAMKG